MWFKKLVSKKVQIAFISYGYLLIKNCQNKEFYPSILKIFIFTVNSISIRIYKN